MEIYVCIALSIVILVLSVIIIVMLTRVGSGTSGDNRGLEKGITDFKEKSIENFAETRGKLDTLRDSLYKSVDQLTLEVKQTEDKVDRIRVETIRNLEEIKSTVDEKLTESLDKRISNSFASVKDALESITRSVGEMKSLATGVDGLKAVLTNVKTRGSWGEISLENLLNDILTPDQYCRQFKVKSNSDERVDYAIIMPGKEDKVYLPVDSKFPIESYTRLVDASKLADKEAERLAQTELTKAIKAFAKSISEKYIYPPKTTDFAVMFLPTEGLYAEALRMPGLAEELMNKNRVVLAGPTTIAALLNSLQIGFRTVAVEKRASDITKLLVKFRGDFLKFNELLGSARKKLNETSNIIDKASHRTELIDKQLSKVDSIAGEQISSDDYPLIDSGDSEESSEDTSESDE